MKWDNSIKTYEALSREARRIRECSSSNSMSLAETNAFSLMLWEIGNAIGIAQPSPMGREISLSEECIKLIHRGAKMAERERRETQMIGSYLPDLTASTSAEIIPIRGRKA